MTNGVADTCSKVDESQRGRDMTCHGGVARSDCAHKNSTSEFFFSATLTQVGLGFAVQRLRMRLLVEIKGIKVPEIYFLLLKVDKSC